MISVKALPGLAVAYGNWLMTLAALLWLQIVDIRQQGGDVGDV